MACAIAHTDDGIPTVDVRLERRPPFTPEAVVEQFAALFKRYRIRTVQGDSHDEDRLRKLFDRHGIQYRRCERSASDLFGWLVDEFNNGRRFAWLDDEVLTAQLAGLVWRKLPSGREVIGHPPGAHDDLINAVAGALRVAERQARRHPLEVGPIELLCTRIYDPRDAPHLGTWDCDPPPRRNW